MATVFGTPRGEMLQQWCMQHGWALFYFDQYGGPRFPNFRLLDPLVAQVSHAAKNYTVAANDSAAFSNLWAQARAGAISPQSAWNTLVGTSAQTSTSLAMRPLSAYECAEPQHCVGVSVRNNTCICRDFT